MTDSRPSRCEGLLSAGGGLAASETIQIGGLTGDADVCNNHPMSNTPARTAETKVTEYKSTGHETTRYETGYRFAKREFGGWHIHLTDASAIRTIKTDSVIGNGTDTSTGHIGWVTKSHEQGWDLWHLRAGENKADGQGREYATREEAVSELIYLLLAERIVSVPSTDRFRYFARDFIDYNELVLTASRTVEQFGWEIEYDAYIARRDARLAQEAN